MAAAPQKGCALLLPELNSKNPDFLCFQGSTQNVLSVWQVIYAAQAYALLEPSSNERGKEHSGKKKKCANVSIKLSLSPAFHSQSWKSGSVADMVQPGAVAELVMSTQGESTDRNRAFCVPPDSCPARCWALPNPPKAKRALSWLSVTAGSTLTLLQSNKFYTELSSFISVWKRVHVVALSHAHEQ